MELINYLFVTMNNIWRHNITVVESSERNSVSLFMFILVSSEWVLTTYLSIIQHLSAEVKVSTLKYKNQFCTYYFLS